MPIDPKILETQFFRLSGMDAESRSAALRDLNLKDAEMAARLAALLDAHDNATLNFDQLGDDSLRELARFDPDELIGAELGGWTLTGKLGRGGMGVVFAGRRENEGIDQQAAIKLLAIPVFDKEAARRFVREASLLARLDHPGICRLRDWGRTREGWAYLVLDRIEGEPIDQVAEKLSIRDRLALMIQVAEAVGAAHRQLIVHLDLKPDNILVDAHGAPILLDFGVARVLSEDSGRATATLTRWLTPDYASPEQLRGEPASVHTDIYALGAVLYELLTGTKPYVLSRLAVTDALARIEQGPPAPSRQRRGVGKDVDAVIARAMHPNPARRYASAGALADDLRALLDQRPVSARPDSLGYRLGKLFRRHPVAASATVVSTTAIAALAVLLAVQADDLRRQRDRANHQAMRAQAASDVLLESIAAANPTGELGASTTVDDMLNSSVRRLGLEVAEDPLLAAESLIRIGDVRRSLGEYDKAVALYERVLTILEGAGGENHDQRISAITGLAAALRATDQFDRALKLVDLEIEKSDQRSSWRLLRSRGTLHVAQGKLERAEQDLAAALRHAPDSDTNSRAHILSTMGNVRTSRGQPAEALEWFERAAALAREAPMDRELLATTLLNSANVLSKTGRIEDALAAADESLQLRLDMYGERHVKTVPSYVIRSYVLMEAGRWSEAIATARKAARLESELAGTDSSRLAAIYGAIGLAADRQGDNETAQEGFSKALAIQERLLPDDHPDLAVTRSNLASVLMALGDYEASLGLLMQAWRVHSDRARGEPSRSQAIAEVNIAWSYLRLDQPEVALDWATKALSGAEKAIGSGQWILGHFRNVYAEALFANGRLDEAEEEALAVEKLYQSSEIPVRPRSIRDNVDLLARIHERNGQPEKAATYRRQLVEFD